MRLGGIVSGVCAASSSTAPTNRSSSASVAVHATLTAGIDQRHGRAPRTPGRRARRSRLRRPSRRSGTRRAWPSRSRVSTTSTPSIAASRSADARRSRARARRPSRARRTCSSSRWSGPSRRSTAGGSSSSRTRGRRASEPPSRPIDRLEREVAAPRTSASRSRRPRSDGHAPMLRPEQPLLGGASPRRPPRAPRGRPGSPRTLCAPSTTTIAPRAWAAPRSAARAGRARSPTARGTPRPAWSVRRSRRRTREHLGLTPARPVVDEDHLHAGSVAQLVQRPDPAGVLDAGGHDPVPGLPVDRPGADVHPVGRAVGDGDVVDVGRQHGGDRRPRLGHALEGLVPVVDLGPPVSQLVACELGHRGGRLARQRPDRPGVQVDAGRQRREGRPDRRQAGRSPGIWGDHGRIIPTMSGLARPEHLATTDWLARAAGTPRCPGPRRPLATGRERRDVLRAGHIPGAIHVDWRIGARSTPTRPRRRAAAGRTRTGWPRSPTAPGSATAARSSSTTTPRACTPRGSGGASGPMALESRPGPRRRLPAPGRPRSRPIARDRGDRGAGRAGHAVHAARPEPDAALTTSDVRGLLGSPDVSCSTPGRRRSTAASRATPGGSGHIPGAINVPVGAMHAPGSQRLRDGDACATGCTRRTSAAAAGWWRTTGRASPRRSSRSC